MVGRGAAAPAGEVDEPGLGELPDHGGGLLGGLLVLTERVGQPRVGVDRHEGVGEPRHLGDVGPHLLRAQGAVEAHGEGPGMAHGVPERLGHLARQGAAGGVGDGAGDDDRPAASLLLEEGLHGEDRGLGVERVEDRLDEDQVAAAVDETAGGLEVRRHQLVVADVAGARVVDVGRDRGRAGRGAEGSRDVARPVGRARGRRVGLAARQQRGLVVELVGQLLHAVVGQRDGVGVEGVGLEDVGAGVEVLAVDARDDVGLGERQQVVVADHVAGPVLEPLAAVAGLVGAVALDGGAHRTVDDEDPLAQERGELGGGVGSVLGRRGHAVLLCWPWAGLASSVGRSSTRWTGFPDVGTGDRGVRNPRVPGRAGRRDPRGGSEDVAASG